MLLDIAPVEDTPKGRSRHAPKPNTPIASTISIAADDQSRYLQRMFRKILALAAWGTLAFICFVSLSPIGLRPVATTDGSAESQRFVAYLVLGLLFVSAYPSRFVRSLAFVVVVALGLEAVQQLTPDRHGRFIDAMEKVAGGMIGCGAARGIQALIECRPRTS